MRAVPAPVPADPDEARKAAQAVALRLLAGREMSTGRLRERLGSRGFPDGVIDEIVARLTRAGILDDGRAAGAAARTLLVVKLRGQHRVGRELERLGFTQEQSRAAVQAVLADGDERAVLDRVVASKLRGRRTIPDAASYRRLFASLLRRGFPSDLIRTALRPYWQHRAEPQQE
ncbi:MAG: RecX family transcriptional regulator [Vicinamibacterales bacterium]